MSLSPVAYRPFLPAQIEGISSVLIDEIQPFVAKQLLLALPPLVQLPEMQSELRGEIEDLSLYLPTSLMKTISIAETDGRIVRRVQVLAVKPEGIPMVTGGILLHTLRPDDLGTAHDLIPTRDFGLRKGIDLAILASFDIGGSGETYVPPKLPMRVGIHSTKGAQGKSVEVGIYRRVAVPEPVGLAWTPYDIEDRVVGQVPESATTSKPSLADFCRKHRGSLPIICAASKQKADFLSEAQKVGFKRVGVDMTPSQYEVRRHAMGRLQDNLGIEAVPLIDETSFHGALAMLESSLALNAEGLYDDGVLGDVCDRLESSILREEHYLKRMEGFIPPEDGIVRWDLLEQMKAQLVRLKGPVRRYIESIGRNPEVYRRDLERFRASSARELADKLKTLRLDLVIIAQERAQRLAALIGAPYYEE